MCTELRVEDIPLHPQYIDVNIKTHSCNSKRLSTIHSILFPMPVLKAFCSLDFNHSISKTVFYYFFWPHHMAHGIFIPKPRIKLVSAAVEVQNLNHWTARKVPNHSIFKESECGYIFLFKNIEWKNLNGN